MNICAVSLRHRSVIILPRYSERGRFFFGGESHSYQAFRSAIFDLKSELLVLFERYIHTYIFLRTLIEQGRGSSTSQRGWFFIACSQP